MGVPGKSELHETLGQETYPTTVPSCLCSVLSTFTCILLDDKCVYTLEVFVASVLLGCFVFFVASSSGLETVSLP